MSDARSVRLLFVAPRTVGELGELHGVTRQGRERSPPTLRRVATATTARDPDDARKLDVTLTEAGRAYGRAIAEVTVLFNLALARRVEPERLPGGRRRGVR